MTTEEMLDLLRSVAERVINPRFRHLEGAQVDEKHPGDYVTVADREAEVLITEAIAAAHPDAVIVGEEAAFCDPQIIDRFQRADHGFTVDPIDGTSNFVRGDPRYAVMVSETRGGQVVRAWIWQPQTQRALVAERGQGMWVNGERMQGRLPGFPAFGAGSDRSWSDFRLGDRVHPVRTISCAGFDYWSVVTGEFDAVTYLRPMPWDHLPGSLMLHEIGGAMYEVTGKDYSPATDVRMPIVGAVTEVLARNLVDMFDPERLGLPDILP